MLKTLAGALASFSLVALAATCFAGQKPLPLDPAKVTLCGLVQIEVVVDDEGNRNLPLMLRLDEPVRVSADEYMEEKSVQVMQIAIHLDKGSDEDFRNEFMRVKNEFGSKRACITGELYHGLFKKTQLTDVLITLRSIELEAKK